MKTLVGAAEPERERALHSIAAVLAALIHKTGRA